MSTFSPKKALLASALGLIFSGNAAQAVTCATVGLDIADYCLQNGNSVFVVDPQDSVWQLNVDGESHVFLQDFFYDDITPVGNKTPDPDTQDFMGMATGGGGAGGGYGAWYQVNQTEVDGAVPTGGEQIGTSSLSFFYAGTGGSATQPLIRLDFELIGGATASDEATIVETFTIINRGNVAMDVSLFAYTDIDLGGGGDSYNDNAALVDSSLTKYRQFDSNFEMLATTNIAVDGYKIGIGDGTGYGGEVLDLFAPGMGNLNLGPGGTGSWGETEWLDIDAASCGGVPLCSQYGADLQMAAQWNRTLEANGGSFSYTHTLSVKPIGGTNVPVPAALPLALSGLGLLGLAGRRKKKVQV